MKVLENTEAFPPYKYFTEVEEKFLKFTPECRVLPARHFNEPSLHFKLRKKLEPGAKGFPNGGFELIGPDGGIYNFELNEVIVHPFQLGMLKYFSTAQNVVNKEKVNTGVPGKRGRPKMDPALRKTPLVYVPKGGKRGRPPLSPEEKAKREAAKASKPVVENTTGKRGRGRPRKIQPL